MTKLKYLEQQHLYEDSAEVVDVITLEDGRIAVLLNETIFYPQGGGQACDCGIIEKDGVVFKVNDTRFVEGIVRHIGEFESGEFKAGDLVNLKIDQERRLLNSKLHTLGHLIDEVIYDLGYTDWTAGKGYHFPDAPFVEYIAEFPREEIEDLKVKIEEKVNDFILQGFEIKTSIVDYSELNGLCRDVPDYIPRDKSCCVAIVWDDKGIPCGGTHVKNIKDIGKVSIRKISSKKGKVKVCYELME